MVRVVLAAVVTLLALPAVGRAESRSAPPAVDSSSPASLCSPSCTNQSGGVSVGPQQTGTGNSPQGAQPAPDPAENQHAAELFLLALLAALFVIVPMTITRQRQRREASPALVLELGGHRGRRSLHTGRAGDGKPESPEV